MPCNFTSSSLLHWLESSHDHCVAAIQYNVNRKGRYPRCYQSWTSNRGTDWRGHRLSRIHHTQKIRVHGRISQEYSLAVWSKTLDRREINGSRRRDEKEIQAQGGLWKRRFSCISLQAEGEATAYRLTILSSSYERDWDA